MDNLDINVALNMTWELKLCTIGVVSSMIIFNELRPHVELLQLAKNS